MANLKFRVTVKVVSGITNETFWQQVRKVTRSTTAPIADTVQAQRFRARFAQSIESRIRHELESRVQTLVSNEYFRFERFRVQSEVDFLNPIIERALADWLGTEEQQQELQQALRASNAGRQIRVKVGQITYGSLLTDVEVFGFEPLAKAWGSGAPLWDFLELCIADAIPLSLDVDEEFVDASVIGERSNNKVVAGVHKESKPAKSEYQNFHNSAHKLWDKVKNAALVPIGITLLLGGYIVYSYRDIEESRREWMKAMLSQQNEMLKTQREESAYFLKEYKDLILKAKAFPSTSPTKPIPLTKNPNKIR